METKITQINGFSRFCWVFLFYNLLVILWGAYVRASGSGAGCGAHWPLCNGVIIPQDAVLATRIEFTHRIMSGFTLVGSILLFFWSRRQYPQRHSVRLGATCVLVFTLTEALLGAGLVLFQLVAKDASVARAVSVAAHLVNTLLLIGILALSAWWASTRTKDVRINQSLDQLLIGIGLFWVMVLSASGAVTALGDTLFPSGSFLEGFQQDFSPTAHFLIRLRVYHPVIAITCGVYLTSIVFWIGRHRKQEQRKWLLLLVGLFFLQLLLGILNVTLLAPVWLQMVHLFVSDLVWISLVLLAASELITESEPAPSVSEQPSLPALSSNP